MAIDPEGIAQTPGIQIVGLGPAGSFALAITLRAFWIYRIDGDSAFQNVFNGGALVGFR